MKLKVLFSALTVVVISFIWLHSVMPGDMSENESGFVSQIIKAVFHISEDADIEFAVRKTAHFTEYAVLGVLLVIDAILWTGRRFSPYCVIVGLLVPLIDETIQLFSTGRSGMVSDVWIDFSGFIIGMMICGLIAGKVRKNKV